MFGGQHVRCHPEVVTGGRASRTLGSGRHVRQLHRTDQAPGAHRRFPVVLARLWHGKIASRLLNAPFLVPEISKVPISEFRIQSGRGEALAQLPALPAVLSRQPGAE